MQTAGNEPAVCNPVFLQAARPCWETLSARHLSYSNNSPPLPHVNATMQAARCTTSERFPAQNSFLIWTSQAAIMWTVCTEEPHTNGTRFLQTPSRSTADAPPRQDTGWQPGHWEHGVGAYLREHFGIEL
eukprot:CAMPEP_0180116584 /NCGR_PEP_ID=MMETSP0986-20121125/454_1 /TAXON_ID=697907 /ORGANISM="non described non described, Strain CCMP2293" /LENGTH=129 /DNA_ID=CAMNT_0022055383 /DNA_START=262 /DNA_END=649 /DNA_ORIENTATION=-